MRTGCVMTSKHDAFVESLLFTGGTHGAGVTAALHDSHVIDKALSSYLQRKPAGMLHSSFAIPEISYCMSARPLLHEVWRAQASRLQTVHRQLWGVAYVAVRFCQLKCFCKEHGSTGGVVGSKLIYNRGCHKNMHMFCLIIKLQKQRCLTCAHAALQVRRRPTKCTTTGGRARPSARCTGSPGPRVAGAAPGGGSQAGGFQGGASRGGVRQGEARLA